MKAWQAHRNGDPWDVLTWDDVPEPDPAPGMHRLRVTASALNFPDILVCQGIYQQRPELPFTPGFEVARSRRFRSTIGTM